MNGKEKKAKVNPGQRSLRHIILLSDWSAGSSPFRKQTEMDLTPFWRRKKSWAFYTTFWWEFQLFFGVIL